MSSLICCLVFTLTLHTVITMLLFLLLLSSYSISLSCRATLSDSLFFSSSHSFPLFFDFSLDFLILFWHLLYFLFNFHFHFLQLFEYLFLAYFFSSLLQVILLFCCLFGKNQILQFS
jgi:hypothetical protein